MPLQLKPTILHQTADYVFVNKPSGILTIPDRHNAELPNVQAWLKKSFAEIFTIHRIDKDTSGCIVFAKNAQAHKYASQLFETRQVQKEYVAILHGAFLENAGIIKNYLQEHSTIKGKMVVHGKVGKEAITEYKVLEIFKNYSYVQFNIHTGRMHQIRVHASNLGSAIICDTIYGTADPFYISDINKKYALSKNEFEEKPILNRLALHAHKLNFVTEQGEQISITAPLPKDMSATLQQLRKWAK